LGRFREADLSRLTVGSIADRPAKVSVSEFAKPPDPEAAARFLAGLPDQLAARAFQL